MPSICLQTDVNEKMRAILVDWLVEVHLKFKVGRVLRGGVVNGGGGGWLRCD